MQPHHLSFIHGEANIKNAATSLPSPLAISGQGKVDCHRIQPGLGRQRPPLSHMRPMMGRWWGAAGTGPWWPAVWRLVASDGAWRIWQQVGGGARMVASYGGMVWALLCFVGTVTGRVTLVHRYNYLFLKPECFFIRATVHNFCSVVPIELALTTSDI